MFEIPIPNNAPFRDREDAGKQLADNFPLDFKPDLILAIPRGGLPVAYEMAAGLGTSMDVIACRKLRIPDNPEAGFGAVSFDGSAVFNEEIISKAQITKVDLRDELEREEMLAKRLMWSYRQGLPAIDVKGKDIALTDDGLATGYTMLSAVLSARRLRAKSISVIVPCAHDDALHLLEQHADNVFALHQTAITPFAVASFYRFWHDLTDQEAEQYINKGTQAA